MVRAGTIIVKAARQTLQVREDASTKKLQFEIDAFSLLNRVQAHFDELRSGAGTQLRTKFEREWDRQTSA
jgi:hypothetical protein